MTASQDFGYPFSDNRTLTADGSGGDIEARYQPDAGSELLVTGMTIINNDILTRTVDLIVATTGNVILTLLFTQGATSGARACWPNGGTGTSSSPAYAPHRIGAGLMFINRMQAVTAGEDAFVTFLGRVHGLGSVTVTEVIA